MSYADRVFVEMCKDILENGTSTEGEKVELIEKKKVQFSCLFNEWAIFQYELNTQQIEYIEEYLITHINVVV